MGAGGSAAGATLSQQARYRTAWIAVAWFGTLLIAAYTPVLAHLFRQWMDDPDMGHGILVSPVALYIAWSRRRELFSIDPRPNWWGVVLVLYGSFQALIGALGAELFLSRTAFLLSLVGVLLFLCGTQATRIVAFPLFLLLFMIPLPRLIFNQIALPLQLLASNTAETLLNSVGIPVLREGNILELASQRLNVVEACSGIRSLLSLSFLALVYAYFFDPWPWMRGALLLASIPITILANASRVAITGILTEYDSRLAEGFFHMAEGWVVFAVSLVVLVLTHRLIRGAVHVVSKHR